MGKKSGLTGQWGRMWGPFHGWGGGTCKRACHRVKGASYGPLCMNAPTSRPVSPAPAISLPPDPFSLPRLACSHPVGMCVYVCVPLSLSFTSVVILLTLHICKPFHITTHCFLLVKKNFKFTCTKDNSSLSQRGSCYSWFWPSSLLIIIAFY